MNRICIFFREKEADRWFRGDYKWRAPIRRLVRGPGLIGGIKQVFINLCRGLEQAGASVVMNIPYDQIRPSDHIGVMGRGIQCLEGYNKPNPILAGIGVVNHPVDWPSLFEDYPVAAYVVHSDWIKSMYERHYGNRILKWQVGIDTDYWSPSEGQKQYDFLIYDKVMWDHDRVHGAMVTPICELLKERGLTFQIIRYGHYTPESLKSALALSRAMLFLCEHETQGLAYQQAMSCGVPVLAWDPGQWLDPWRFRYGEGYVQATTVPFFDERCGRTFSSWIDFESGFDEFLEMLNTGRLQPREYVLENLTLRKCGLRYLEMLREVNC
jgi:hypothetical protein